MILNRPNYTDPTRSGSGSGSETLNKRVKHFQGFPRRLDWPLPKNFQDKKNSCSSKNSICIIACLSIFPSIVLFIRPYNYTSVLSVNLFYLSIFFIYLEFNLFSPTGLKLLPIPFQICAQTALFSRINHHVEFIPPEKHPPAHKTF